MSLLFLHAAINNTAGEHQHRGKGSTGGWMMLGTSELLEKVLLVFFSCFIFLLQRAGAVAAGGRGDGAGGCKGLGAMGCTALRAFLEPGFDK